MVMPPSPLTAALNPDVALNDLEKAAVKETKVIQSSFDELVEELEKQNTCPD